MQFARVKKFCLTVVVMGEHETGVSISWLNYGALSVLNSLSRDK